MHTLHMHTHFTCTLAQTERQTNTHLNTHTHTHTYTHTNVSSRLGGSGYGIHFGPLDTAHLSLSACLFRDHKV